jgi:hypothetical protein
MKKIVYSAVDRGIDGMGKPHILYSSFDEMELNSLIESDPSKPWRTKDERIVDTEIIKRTALSKLNGIERLVLGLPNWLEDKVV